jgi:methionine-rich copper-binding protein CopC
VALGAPISVTFSKPVNCSTLTTSTFIVNVAGGAAIGGAVTCSGSTATFTPSSALVLHTLYTGTITTGVTDLVGNAMVQNYSWNFEAVAGPSVLSTTPATGASGLTFTPAISATFLQLAATDPDYAGAALNCSTVTTSTFTVTAPAPIGTVTGTVACSGATATFTPTAPLAAGITYTANLSTGVQNAAGTGLASAYSWSFSTDTLPTVLSTTPASNATGVLLNQAISATFSKAMNCATLYSTGTTPTVSVTAPAPVGSVTGTVSCTGSGTGVIFTPSNPLANNTLYTAIISTGALDAQGEPMAGSYSWSFLTVPAPTAPTVIATVPTPTGVTGVATSQAVQATFSEAMNSSTIISPATNFTLTAPGPVTVAGTVTYAVAGSVATFTPTSALTASTTYTATIKTGVQDLSGNALANAYVWTFTTGAAADTTHPTVTSENPVNGATGVQTNQIVTATFSKPMNAGTITATSPATFTLIGPSPATTVVGGLVTYASVGNTLTFTPTAALAAGVFTATITTAATDLSGNALTATGGLALSWSFTVGSTKATAGPYITLTSPLDTATSVPVNQAVSATFNTAMNPLTFTSSTFTLTSSTGTVITGNYSYSPTTLVATFTPSANLLADTTYTADITSGVTDSSTPGNALVSGLVPNPWFFTTAGSSGPPPVVLGTAGLFGDFGGTAGMTNQGILTVINGDTGTSAVSTGVTGFHDTTLPINGAVWPCTYTQTPLNIGQVNGTIYTDPPPPNAPNCPLEGTAATATIAAQAAADSLTAYNQMVAMAGIAVEGCAAPQCTSTGSPGPGELGGRTLQAGVYKSTPGTYSITSLPLTLDAQGNPNATWVFQMSKTLTVGGTAPQSIIMINGAQAANVFWQVGSAATINGACGGTFYGTVISQAGVTTGTAGTTCAITTINGRLISLGAAVTLVNTVVNVPAP